MSDELFDAMVNMRESEALEVTRVLTESGIDPLNILDTCTKAMEMVGTRFEQGKYFLPELMLAGEMLKQISERVKPYIKGAVVTEKKGRVLMGTVEGDIHDIGKDMVVFLLDVNGYEVMDIGIDASPEAFVNGIKDFRPQVVGMSGLLTLAYDSMKNTVEAIKEAGLREQVRIMVGGGQVTEKVRDYSGADAFGKDALDGVLLMKKWVGA